MVDSINSIGKPQVFPQNGRTRDGDGAQKARTETAKSSEGIETPDKILSFSDAEKAAEETRDILQERQDLTLSVGGRQVNQLL